MSSTAVSDDSSSWSFHLSEVHDGWVTSLLASRGQPSPAPPELHGQITIKETRSRAYAAVWGHDLWIYPNKEGFQLGIASFSVPLNVATVKSTGKHSLTLITPYKSFKYTSDCLSVYQREETGQRQILCLLQEETL